MKKKILIALVLALFVFLTGFSTDYDNAEVRADTEAALDALIAGDYMALRGCVSQRVTDEELTAFFQQVSEGMQSLDSYELKAVARKIETQDGLNYMAILYEMTAGDQLYQVEVAKVEGESGLAGFSIEQDDDGIVAQEAPSGIINWVFAAVALLTVGFTVWMVVDCVRRRMKRKWLWIPLILLVTILLTFTFRDGGVNFRFNIGLFLGLSDVAVYTDGSFAAQINVPLGALIYLTQRRQLTIPREVSAVPGSETEE